MHDCYCCQSGQAIIAYIYIYMYAVGMYDCYCWQLGQAMIAYIYNIYIYIYMQWVCMIVTVVSQGRFTI